MSTGTILLIALLLAIPISVKYLLAFEARNLLERLRDQEDEVKYLSAQWRALERERLVMRRAVNQVEGQRRQAQTRRGMVAEKLGQMYHPEAQESNLTAAAEA